MKAEELMIGDWVNLYDNPIKINIDDLDFIERDETYDKGAHCKLIPLTKEILEKNSFLEVVAIEYPYHGVGISFLYRDTPEGLRIFVQNACAGGPTCTMIKTCKYVHEVQHMIKMCDIGKEIVL